MKLRKQFHSTYGLRAKLGKSLIISAILCIFLFAILNTGCKYIFDNYYENSDFEQSQFQRQCESLQHFIDKNQISSQNLSQLKKWEKKQPVVLMELYAKDVCIYSSIYDVPVSSMMLDDKLNSRNYVEIKLVDQTITAFIFSDFTYQLSMVGTAISMIAAFVLFILLFFNNSKQLIRYICQLNEEVQILEGGNLEYCVTEEGNDELTDLAHSMNRMRTTLQNQIETEQKLYQANRQLITEMSHDLRTPLTGIMLYLEILRSHRYDSEKQLQDYLEKIDAKAHHMKLLSDHLFEYSMQEIIEKQIEPKSMEAAFDQVIKNMREDLNARGFSVNCSVEWTTCLVQVNLEYVHRIFENIISNIEKYAEHQADVMVQSINSEQHCGFVIMNSFHAKTDEIESNGVGIDSIRRMMKQMNGNCIVEQTDATFEITLLFPKQ